MAAAESPIPSSANKLADERCNAKPSSVEALTTVVLRESPPSWPGQLRAYGCEHWPCPRIPRPRHVERLIATPATREIFRGCGSHGVPGRPITRPSIAVDWVRANPADPAWAP